MPASTEGFYAANATRCWPLDDSATATDDNGQPLPSGLLVDLSIRFPDSLGSYLSLSALSVTPQMVTAVFVASDLPAIGPDGPTTSPVLRPCAVISIAQPIDIGRHYPVQGLTPGVAGWVVLGDDINEPYQGRFSSIGQGMILASLARSYQAPPVPSIGLAGSGSPLSGIVTLRSGQDIELTVGPATIVPPPGVSGPSFTVTNAIQLSLVDSLNRDTFALYSGDCQVRPESGNCPSPPIQEISGVSPDCSGTLTIQFPGLSVTPLAGGSAVLLNLARGLSATCGSMALPDADGRTSGQGGDLCASGAIPSSSNGPDPLTCIPGDGSFVVPSSPASGCPAIYDTFASLPFAPGGEWSSAGGASFGQWTAGVEATPTTLHYGGGATMLTKRAPHGSYALDYFTPRACANATTVLGTVVTTLAAPDAASSAAVAAGVQNNTSATFAWAIWDKPGRVLAIETVAFGGVPSRLASVPLDPSLFGSLTWAEITLAVTRLPGGGCRFDASLVSAPLGGSLGNPGSPSRIIYDFSPGLIAFAPATSVFALASPNGAAFAYYFQRDQTTENTP